MQALTKKQGKQKKQNNQGGYHMFLPGFLNLILILDSYFILFQVTKIVHQSLASPDVIFMGFGSC